VVEVDPLQPQILARSQMQGQIDNDCENNRAEDAKQSALLIYRDRGQQTGGDSGDGNDGGSLCHGFGFNLKGKLHAQKCEKEGE
jgi:hypothetical protein